MSDSTVPGYLQSTAAVLYGAALEDLFQRVIVGVTGLPGALVRPKFQDEPPNLPDFNVNWAAFSVFVEPVLANAYKTLVDDLVYTVQGTEVLQVMVSFYGPNFQEFERSWRDGIQLGQNRDELTAADIAFIEFADPATVPVLLKQKWVKKVDVRGTFHRWATRTYEVRTLLSANGTINADQTPAGEVIGTISTDPPPT